MLRIEKAGYYPDVSMADYLADPCPEPALSTGIVQALFDNTPKHAWQKHPRLGGAVSEQSARLDIGSAVHELVRNAGSVVFGAFDDWRTKVAQQFRDEAREQGLIPLLDKQRAVVETAAANARKAIELLGPGKSEVTMVWQSGGVWCRSRADWLSDGPIDVELPSGKRIVAPHGVDVDYKTVLVADADAFIATSVHQYGYDVQAGLRHLGHLALGGQPREMLWLLQEIEPPFGTRFVGVGFNMLALAEKKTVVASKRWRRCLDEKSWPDYELDIVYAEPTTTAIWRAEARGVQL